MTKIDEEKRLVYGIATQEVQDRSGETMDYESSKPNFEKWSQDIEKASGGKSLGNLREMHTNKAAGKLTQLNFNDDQKAIEVCAKVVDEDSWNKVQEGVLTGFSIGGSYAKRWRDADTTRFTASPAEISLVDLPCVPTATFEVIKANGLTEQRQFKNKEENNVDEINKTVLDNFNKALADKDLAKAFSFEEITERLNGALQGQITTPFNCGYFYVKKTYPDCVIIKGNLDGDGDEDLYKVEYTMDAEGVITLGNISEVRMEFVPATDEDNPKQMFGLTQKSAEPTDLQKAAKRKDVTPADKEHAEGEYGDVAYADETNKKYPIDTEEHVRAAASYFGMPKNREKYSAEEQKKIDSKIAAAKKKFNIGEEKKTDDTKKAASVEDLQKAGAAHSKDTLAKLQQMHHAIAEMGGACKCDKCMKMYGAQQETAKAVDDTDLHKSMGSNSEELMKAMEGLSALQKAFTGLKSENEALRKSIDALENRPLPGGAMISTNVSSMEKQLGVPSSDGSSDGGELAVLKKMCDEERDPMVKQAISQKIAVAAMKEAQQLVK